MSSQKLLLDRLEFSTVKVVAAKEKFAAWDKNFPQLDFDFDGITFLTRSALHYSPDEASDPRHFALSYGVKLDSGSSPKKVPYELEIEVTGYFRYLGDDEFQGADRFRAVRFSGYQILYGAIREMVCNLTARAPHGLFQLPARNFGLVAKERAEKDEVTRLALMKKTEELTPKKKRIAIPSQGASDAKVKPPRVSKKNTKSSRT
jgi:hypothetical protein